MIEAQALKAAVEPFKIDATAAGFIVAKAGEEPSLIQATGNVVVTDVVKVNVEKAADKEFADVGDRIKYTVTLFNNSSVDLYDVKIVNKICTKTTVISSSIDPAPQPGEFLGTGVSVTSPDEISAGSVPKGKSAALKYEATINEGETGEIVNCANAVIKFRDQKGNEYTGQTESSAVVTNIVEADLQIVESADKTFVTENNEEVVFTLTIKNTGNIKINDITVTSSIPDGMNYKENSTLKNGAAAFVNENPADSLSIGDLNPEEIYKIQFSVTVSM